MPDALFIDPSGQLVSLPAEQAAAATGSGYVPASQKQIDDFRAEEAFHEKFGGAKGELAAAGLGAGRALSFGLLDLALTKTGAMSAEDIRSYREENPVSSALGTAAGIVAPALLTGGASVAGAAPGAIKTVAGLTGPGLAAKAGQGARAAVESVLGQGGSGALGQIVARAVKTGAGSGVESAAYALGHQVSEKALGAPDLTAESAAASVGLSGLLGFGVGAAGSAAWNLGANVFSNISAKETIAGWLGDLEGNASLKATGGLTKTMRDRLAKQMGSQEAVTRLGKDAQGLGLIPVGASPDLVLEKAQALKSELSPAFKTVTQGIDTVLKPGEAPQIARVIARTAGSLQDVADDPLQKGAVTKIASVFDDYATRYGEDAGGMSFADLHEMRKRIDVQLYGVRRSLDPDRSVLMEGLHDLRRSVNQEIDDTIAGASGLPRTALSSWKDLNHKWGVAAKIEDLANVGISRRMGNNAFSLTDQIVGSAGGAGGAAGAVMGGEGLGGLASGTLTGLVTATAHKIVRQYGPGVVAKLAGAGERALSGAAMPVIPGIAAAGEAGLSNVTAGVAEKMIRSAVPLGAMASVVENTADGIERERRFPGSPDISGTSEEIGSNPMKVAILADLERTRNEIANRIDVGAGNITRGSVRGERTSQGESAPGVDRDFAADADRSLATYGKRVKALQIFSQSPQNMMKLLTGQTDTWYDHAPDTAQQMNIVTARAVSFLLSKIPNQPMNGPLASRWDPSRSEVATFTRYWDAVENPLGILKQATAGNLTTEALEAVKVVYPALMRAIQGSIGVKLTSLSPNGQVQYRHRMMISALLGQDMDGSMSPGQLGAAQGMYAQQKQQQMQAVRPSAGKSKITLAKRSMTDQQASASRGEEK